MVACGALAASIREIAARRGWRLEVHALPPLLHNRPGKIAPRVEEVARRLAAEGKRVVVAYADCGSYGALDEVCGRLGLRRLEGLHCYDVLAGPEQVKEIFAAEAGTYVLTDFLVRSFRRSVLRELGLDRYPELWSDYFGQYRRVVWLAEERTPETEAEARAVAEMFALPLAVVEVGVSGLESQLEALIAGSA